MKEQESHPVFVFKCANFKTGIRTKVNILRKQLVQNISGLIYKKDCTLNECEIETVLFISGFVC